VARCHGASSESDRTTEAHPEMESFDDDDEASIAFQVLDSSVEVALIEDSVTSQHGPTCNHVTQNERQPGSMQMRKPL